MYFCSKSNLDLRANQDKNAEEECQQILFKKKLSQAKGWAGGEGGIDHMCLFGQEPVVSVKQISPIFLEAVNA